jgi:hypothetical protein
MQTLVVPKKSQAVDLEEALANASAQLTDLGVVNKSTMKLLRYTIGYEQFFIDQGYEHRGAGIHEVIRVPLAKQITRNVAATGRHGVAVARIKTLANGARPGELTAVVVDLLASGELVEVLDVRGSLLFSRQHAPRVYTADERADVISLLTKQLAVLKKATKSKLGKTAPLPQVTNFLPSAPNTVTAHHPASATTLHQRDPADATPRPRSPTVLDSRLRDLLATQSGPVRVPDLLRQLGTDQATAVALVLAAARRGEVSLEPESGMGRLSSQDAAWCPDGPGGTKLSWLMLSPNAVRGEL